ncbi:MAG: primosomal protein N', partial [Planctomycetota bacterium]
MPRPDPHAAGRLWLEEGEGQAGLTATVAPIGPIDQTYTYAVPTELAERLKIGQRVCVPLGKRGRLVAGFCVELGGEWRHTLRAVHSLIDEETYLSPPLLELGRWVSRHYCCPLGRTLAALVPEAVRRRSGFVNVRYARLLRPLEAIASETIRLGTKSRALLEVSAQAESPLDVETLLARTGASANTLRAAADKGWIEITTERRLRPPPRWDVPRVEPAFELNGDQEAALRRLREKLDAGGFSVTLLYGVSGSGKTEVYIRAMRRVLEQGGQVIMLVPEIALTTQLVQRLAARFDDVAVIHSGLTGVHRSLTWRAIARGERRVVIGTRSAVFAPCARLGLIVVDEEQEASYKNLQAPRFHVRDVAIKRAQMAGIPILLGSATPSLETWLNCRRLEHYERVDLPVRVRDLPLPEVQVVDMRGRSARSGDAPALSEIMRGKIAETLGRGEQAVMLINRRGFASLIRCPACRWQLRCPQCNVGMVFHLSKGKAACHHCRARVTVPELCPDPSCRTRVQRSGAGTQRVEEELTAAFPRARIARADSDTMKRGADYQRLIERFSAREIDLLLGTQMIGKGLDFPHVSFVGVVGADPVGPAADFRASERLFHLITQVAGRAGREQAGGTVVVQTLVPDAVAVQAAMQHDFGRFAESELDVRRRLGLPPFTRFTRFLLADPSERQLCQVAEAFAAELRRRIAEGPVPDADVLGPQPCALPRLRGRYRYDVL